MKVLNKITKDKVNIKPTYDEAKKLQTELKTTCRFNSENCNGHNLGKCILDAKDTVNNIRGFIKACDIELGEPPVISEESFEEVWGRR